MIEVDGLEFNLGFKFGCFMIFVKSFREVLEEMVSDNSMKIMVSFFFGKGLWICLVEGINLKVWLDREQDQYQLQWL